MKRTNSISIEKIRDKKIIKCKQCKEIEVLKYGTICKSCKHKNEIKRFELVHVTCKDNNNYWYETKPTRTKACYRLISKKEFYDNEKILFFHMCKSCNEIFSYDIFPSNKQVCHECIDYMFQDFLNLIIDVRKQIAIYYIKGHPIGRISRIFSFRLRNGLFDLINLITSSEYNKQIFDLGGYIGSIVMDEIAGRTTIGKMLVNDEHVNDIHSLKAHILKFGKQTEIPKEFNDYIKYAQQNLLMKFIDYIKTASEFKNYKKCSGFILKIREDFKDVIELYGDVYKDREITEETIIMKWVKIYKDKNEN